jgi:hypothetical protein
MRQRTFFTLALALVAVLSLPVFAAELPAATDLVDVVDVEQATEAVVEETPETVEFDLESVMDDGRAERACNVQACNARCEAQYGSFAAGYCNNGVCECAV